MVMTVTSGFNLSGGAATKREELNNTYAFSDDLTVVKGSHQLAFGGQVQYWEGDYNSSSRTGGNWIIDGRATGLGLADLMVGRVTSLEHGGPNILNIEHWYMGLYAQASWRLSSRLTLNAGMRWEPYFGQNVLNNAVTIFVMDNFLTRTHTSLPAGCSGPHRPVA
jgi:outer membrane receptor protein involved in Fe transport